MTHKPTPQQIIAWVREEAEQLRHIAGQSGSMTDGGAGELERQLDVYASAFEGVIPTVWRGFVERRILESDPEYQEYMRLSAKFKGCVP
jgi:hypothetical protein